MKRLIIILFLATACTSCITMTLATVVTTTAYALGAGTTRLKGNTVTRIDDKAAVMRTNKGEFVCIVYHLSTRMSQMRKLPLSSLGTTSSTSTGTVTASSAVGTVLFKPLSGS